MPQRIKGMEVRLLVTKETISRRSGSTDHYFISASGRDLGKVLNSDWSRHHGLHFEVKRLKGGGWQLVED